MGKSRLVESILLQLISQGAGACLVDIDSRTADDAMSHLNEFSEYLDPLTQWKTHYLKPSQERAFAYDPFHTCLTGRDREFWLARRVDSLKRILCRPHGIADLRQQMRRDRVLTDALYFVGTPGKDGRHLGLHKLLDALDSGNDRWERDFNMVCENLPVEIARDNWRLHHMNARDRRSETESALNIVRPVFTPFVKQTLSGKAPPIDFVRIVKHKEFVLASLAETPFFSQEQGRIFGAMITNDVEEACWFVQDRYFFICEESEKVLGEDFRDVLNRGRKRRLSAILVGHSLSAFRDQYTDITNDVLSQPATHILFQQKTDLDEWSELAFTGTLRFDRVWKPMDRPDGHNWFVVPEVSATEGRQSNWSDGQDTSVGDTAGRMENEGESVQEGMSETRTKQVSHGKTKGSGITETEQHAHSSSRTGPDGLAARDVVGKSKTSGSSDSHGTQYSDTEQESETESDGSSQSTSISRGRKTGRGRNWSQSVTHGSKQSLGGGTTAGRTIAFRRIPLQRYRTEWYPAGLEEDVPTQYAKGKRRLRRLRIQEIMVIKAHKRPVVCRTHDLPDPFEELPLFGREITKCVIKRICERQPYFFVPTECEKWVRKPLSPKPRNGSSNGSTTLPRWSRYGFIARKPPRNGSQNSNGEK
jgi:hypothetical protein